MAHGDICHGDISEIIGVGLNRTFWTVGDVRNFYCAIVIGQNAKSFCRALYPNPN